MNTNEYMPFTSVAPITLKQENPPFWSFYSGTGFFVKCPPYNSIFFITAKHCILDSKNQPMGHIRIKLNFDPQCNKVIPFNLAMYGRFNDEEFLEDVIIYAVGDVKTEDYKILKNRALTLPNEELVEFLIKKISKNKLNVRILGYPSVSKEIDYDNHRGRAQARGIVGRATHVTPDMRMITVEELNWKDGDIEGFSGSPAIEFMPSSSGKVEPIPIGIVSTGNRHLFKFISINVATNLIAEYLGDIHNLREN